jgi:hypothetical protein
MTTTTTASDKDAKEAVKIYTFFNPKLRDDSYATGDIYDHKKVADSQEEWKIYKYVGCILSVHFRVIPSPIL